MSMTWTLPNIAEHEYGKPPSIWWCVIAFVVIQIAGIVITVLTWEQGKPVMSGTFFVRALLLPLLVLGAVCALIYIGYEEWIERVDWWNFLCRSARADWRQWAQAHVAIVGSTALTPEPELAERLLGLEGSAPMNPGKFMALPVTADPAGASRIGLILEQLVTPFAMRRPAPSRRRAWIFPPAHDVDHAIGKPGPVNALLLQALAAQMVEHGQGAQLVASPGGQGVMLNLVGTQHAPVPHVDAGYFRMLSLSATIGVACCLVLIMFLLEAAGASSGGFWGCIAVLVLMLPLQIGGSILKRRLLEDDFNRQLRRSGART
jgi:hypothetical protein